jgi:hypothetical protein
MDRALLWTDAGFAEAIPQHDPDPGWKQQILEDLLAVVPGRQRDKDTQRRLCVPVS